MGTVNLFKGLGVALVTPFKNTGEVDYSALSNMVDYLINGGINFLCALGTTAETPTISYFEQELITKRVVAQVDGRVPILVGCTSNCTTKVIERLNKHPFKGVNGILSAVPYYNKPTQEGIYQHFSAIAKESELPIILYNIPGRTGVNMTSETTLRLAVDYKNIIGIKEASGDIEQIREIIKNKPDEFSVISGDDPITLQAIRYGASGVISVIGNALPTIFGNMVHKAMAKDYSAAELINSKLENLYRLLFVEGNPAGIKALLYLMNKIEYNLRLPLTPVTANTMNQIREELKKIEA
ncbi:MAG TPA: 4-hydroxy-tetrahydrodipicolinate synthase [Bacteroidaceae bacterium]|nr:4-hydroxy-tetrahydrodipicolinate synthase [Bacteroidaceae bacterium]